MNLFILLTSLLLITQVTCRYVRPIKNDLIQLKEMEKAGTYEFAVPMIVRHVKTIGNTLGTSIVNGVSRTVHVVVTYIKGKANNTMNSLQTLFDKPHNKEIIYNIMINLDKTIRNVKLRCNLDELEVLKRCTIAD